MALEVIGAGLYRTGTESLKRALECLCYNKCYHMIELIDHPEHLPFWEAGVAGQQVDWDQLFSEYQAAVDYPASYYWRELIQKYPSARVILTIRDAARWYRSSLETVLEAINQIPGDDMNTGRRRLMVRKLLAKQGINSKPDEKFMVDFFHEHCEEVKRVVSADRLLVYEVKDGWSPLCDFLEKEIPSVEFPYGNTAEQFKDNFLE